jgi:hypothetical protein
VNDTVYIGSGSGTLYGLSTRTGRVRWRDKLGRPIPWSVQLWDMQTGLAAAEGTLVVPALGRLVLGVRELLDAGKLSGNETLEARAVVTVDGLEREIVVTGEIALAGEPSGSPK